MRRLNTVVVDVLRTQKAIGIRQLMFGGYWSVKAGTLSSYPEELGCAPPPIDTYYIGNTLDLETLIENMASLFSALSGIKEWMIRPCPTNPAHGFIESEPAGEVQFASLLRNKWAQTLQADSDGEILVMPFVDAKFSGIYVEDGHLTIGSGYDGVTGGKKSLPLCVAPLKSITHAQRQSVRVGNDPNTKLIFFEFVAKPAIPVIVQARGGPSVPFALDYAPTKTVVVDKLYEASIDIPLTEWKEIVEKELVTMPGIGVYCPGADLTSHIAIHCVSNKIPFFSSFKPELGKQYEIKDDGAPFNEAEFKRGVSLAFQKMQECQGMGEFGGLLTGGIFIMRNIPYLMKSADPRAWAVIGFGLEAVALGGALAVIGESRRSVAHIIPSGMPGKPSYWGEWMKKREEFWNRVGLAGWMLNHEKHGNSAIGGPKWVMAAISTLKVHNRLMKFTFDGFNEALSEANELVDLAHNTGWLLNKFIEKYELDLADQKPFMILGKAGYLIDYINSHEEEGSWQMIPERVYRAANRRYNFTCDSAGKAQLSFEIPELAGGRKMKWMKMPFNNKFKRMVRELIEEA